MDIRNKINEILIIEDERVIAMVCKRILSRKGFNITLAPDGNIAVDLIKKTKYDLFLIDIKIPGIDGLGVYQYISQIYPPNSFRVIFMTGDTLSTNILEFETKTGCRLLKKPFSIDDLLKAVKNA
ncbi:MAG: response regulator [Dehalococcoidales bacterium]|nr:response regulator [Dehalococcoidales bacterium]